MGGEITDGRKEEKQNASWTDRNPPSLKFIAILPVYDASKVEADFWAVK